jgi:hypothetical protein
MYDNYNYPAGADTPDAPWNEREVPEIGLKAEITVLLKKSDVKVFTSNYNFDEDGKIELNDCYSDIEEYYEKQCNSIPKLLGELAKYINGELAVGNISRSRRQELKAMLEDCEGWEATDIEAEEYTAV